MEKGKWISRGFKRALTRKVRVSVAAADNEISHRQIRTLGFHHRAAPGLTQAIGMSKKREHVLKCCLLWSPGSGNAAAPVTQGRCRILLPRGAWHSRCFPALGQSLLPSSCAISALLCCGPCRCCDPWRRFLSWSHLPQMLGLGKEKPHNLNSILCKAMGRAPEAAALWIPFAS